MKCDIILMDKEMRFFVYIKYFIYNHTSLNGIGFAMDDKNEYYCVDNLHDKWWHEDLIFNPCSAIFFMDIL